MAGEKTVIDNLRVVMAQVHSELAEGVGDAMDHIAGKIRAGEHRFTNRTGETEKTTVGGLHAVETDKIIGRITTGTEYAQYLEVRGAKDIPKPIDVFSDSVKRGDWAFIANAMLAHKDEILPIIAKRVTI